MTTSPNLSAHKFFTTCCVYCKLGNFFRPHEASIVTTIFLIKASIRKICSKMITSIIRYHKAISYIVSITRDRFFCTQWQICFFLACLLLSVFTPAWWDPTRSKLVAGYWHDVLNYFMVPYDAGDHFWTNFSIVLWCWR